jgi:acyl dehydratase
MTTQAVKGTRQPWSRRSPIRLVVAEQDFLVSRQAISTYRGVIESGCTDRLVAPPLFPTMAAGRACRKAVETLLDQHGKASPDGHVTQHVIQVAHDMTIERPVRAGDALHTEVAISSAEATPLGSRAELGVSVQDTNGSLVASFVNRVLIRSSVDGPRPLLDAAQPEPRTQPSDECSTRLAIGYSQNYEFAWATGDYNQIHLDRYSALSAGLPGVVANGMCTLAMVIDRAVSARLGNDESAVHKVSCRFSRPVRLGEEMGVQFRSLAPEEAGHGSRECVSLRALVRDGVALKGMLEVRQA